MKYDKDIDEALDEATLAQQQEKETLPEAPASANVRVVSKNGYEWQITMRTTSVSQLFKQIQIVEDLLESHGWQVPEWKKQKNGISETKKEGKPTETKKCPDCGSVMYLKTVKKEGKNKGKQFWSCPNTSCKKFIWKD